jgi:hypothetical protein
MAPNGPWWGLLVDPLVVSERAIPFLTVAGIAALIGCISFYASTLARSTVQALAPAILGIIAAWLWLLTADIIHLLPIPLWRGWLGHILSAAVMIPVLLALTFWNFKHALVGWPVWRRNALALFISLASATVATATIYHRAWELLVPVERPHGPARLNSGARLGSDGVTAFVQSGDGRVWITDLRSIAPAFTPLMSKHHGFFEGTNWARMDQCLRGDFIGIQRDGSLWVLSHPSAFAQSNPSPGQMPLAKWKRVGSENDWKSVAAASGQALLLKTNGTLWRLGTNTLPAVQVGPGLSAFTPERLGNDSDWADLFSSNYRMILRKADRQIWVSPPIATFDEEKLDFAGLSLHRTEYLDRYSSIAEVMGSMGLMSVGVHEDGTFRVAATLGSELRRGKVRPAMIHSDTPLDAHTNWLAVAVAAGLEHVVTLRADGTLWRWTFLRREKTSIIADTTPHRLGVQSDWVAIAAAMHGVVSLAADGTLWFWEFEPTRFVSASYEPLMRASRRPRLVGNLFTDASR